MGGGSILVVGGRGMLGQALCQALTAAGRAFRAPLRDELDLQRPDTIAACVARERPRLAINAAAFSDVAGAEDADRHGELMAVNRDGPGALAASCRRHGVRLIHVSTDFVFDGKLRRPYRETDAVAPLQAYGRSKLEGERAVHDADPRALIVRTSTLYGPGPRARPHYVDAIARQAERGGPLAVVRLPVSSPTYTIDLAQALVALADLGADGLLHVVNDGSCSRLELAREIVRLAGCANVTVDERPESPAGPRRPPYSVLDTSAYTRLTGRPLRSWSEALADYLRRRGR